MKTATYIIYDTTFPGTHQYIGKVQVGNGKYALRKFVLINMMLVGEYFFRKANDGDWEMISQYGIHFRAVREA